METFFNANTAISDTIEFKNFKKDFKSNISFIKNFSELINYNSRIITLITEKKAHIFNHNLLTSSLQTMKSIELCCSIGSFTDANTLIRKLRDDLVLYVFILAILNRRQTFPPEDLSRLKTNKVEEFVESFSQLRITSLTDNEKVVEAWMTNTIQSLSKSLKRRLNFENYMTFLKQDDHVQNILFKFKLQTYWETLRNNLNNNVHTNGTIYSFYNSTKSFDSNLGVHLKNVHFRTSYITTFFLVLISMYDSALMASTDMVDYMDCNLTPPENCQYEIAPFIQKFIDEKVIQLHPELKEYLKKNNINGMIIN